MGNRLGTRVLVLSIFLVMMVFSMIAMQRKEELTNQLKSMEIVNKHLKLIQESRCKINASGFLKFPRSKLKSSLPSNLPLFPNLVSWLFDFCADYMPQTFIGNSKVSFLLCSLRTKELLPLPFKYQKAGTWKGCSCHLILEILTQKQCVNSVWDTHSEEKRPKLPGKCSILLW